MRVVRCAEKLHQESPAVLGGTEVVRPTFSYVSSESESQMSAPDAVMHGCGQPLFATEYNIRKFMVTSYRIMKDKDTRRKTLR
jgi:hypothetical protein